MDRTMAMLKIFLVDDHQVLLDGLKLIIDAENNMECVGTASNGSETLEKLTDREPDLLIVDVNLPDMNGISLCKIVKRLHPEIRLLAMSMYSNPSFVKQMMRAGSAGYFLKDRGRDSLLHAINTVVSGGTYLPKEISDMFNRETNYSSINAGTVPELSPRE